MFPYTLDGSTASQVPAGSLRKNCRNTWDYLENHEAELRGRESGKADGPNWYGFIYRKNLTLFETPKLIVQVIAQSPRFAFDANDLYFSGGGNGPYYGVRWLPVHAHRSLHFLQALLNSRVSDYFIRHVSTTFRGGYWSYGKRFIEQIPIAPAVAPQELLIDGIVKYLLWLNHNSSDQGSPQLARDALMLGYFEHVLNGLVYELYFPDELHESGLRLFELVEQAELPELDSIPEPQRLARLREIFETIYDTNHPLRGALFNLGSLETVRIIEARQ